jgi:drug/metabolite transporter (DMT)-like permease
MLYLGAGLGMLPLLIWGRRKLQRREAKITRGELPYAIAMVLLDIAAPILLMLGLHSTESATVSLLNDFEVVATTLIAALVFKEAIGKRMWLAILLITGASVILTVDDPASLSFSPGAILVLLACVCWGVENNCTNRLSLKDPLQIVCIKGFASGTGALIIALAAGAYPKGPAPVLAALALGFVAYGLSIYFYIRAQRGLGAARTSAFYALAPFVGVGLSLILLKESPAPSFWVALVVMSVGTYLVVSERHEHRHSHTEIEHEHRHEHSDEHHRHKHEPPVEGEHSHFHSHEALTHNHAHSPDLHHTHLH